MKSKLLLWIAVLVFLLTVPACSSKQFPAGNYKPLNPSSDNSVTEFNFTQDGTYTVLFYNGLKGDGAYTVSGDRITFNETGDSPCVGYPYTMSWASTGNTLTLKSVEDTCPAMLTTDLAGEWDKQP